MGNSGGIGFGFSPSGKDTTPVAEIQIDVTEVVDGTPTAVLFVNPDGTLGDDPNFIYLSSGTANGVDLFSESNSATMASAFTLLRSRVGSTAVQTSDLLGDFGALGYDGDSYAAAARIAIKAGETISSTLMSGAFEFQTNDGTALGQQSRMFINQYGHIGIGMGVVIHSPDSEFEIRAAINGGNTEFFTISNATNTKNIWVLDTIYDTYIRHNTTDFEIQNVFVGSYSSEPFCGMSNSNSDHILALVQHVAAIHAEIYLDDGAGNYTFIDIGEGSYSSTYTTSAGTGSFNLDSNTGLASWALASAASDAISQTYDVSGAPLYQLNIIDTAANGVFLEALGGSTDPYYTIGIMDTTYDNHVYFYPYATRFQGGISYNVFVKSSVGAYNVPKESYYNIINKSSGAATIVNLPVGSTLDIGTTYIFKDGKGDANTNNITITPNAGAGDTIDGAATSVINTNYGCQWVAWNGTQWNVLAKF